MSEQVTGNSGRVGSAREHRGPTCSPAVPLPARRSPSEHRPSQEVRGDAERGLVGGPPARWEPEVRSPESVYPRIVTPGIETQNPLDQVPERGMSCRPDWIRLVGPESQTKLAFRYLLRSFGPATGHNRGAMYFDEGTVWHPGVLYSKGHSAGIVMVDIQGSRLSSMSVPSMMELTNNILSLGFYCTRIDLAVDHVGMDLRIHQRAHVSCKAGELCKLRSYADDSEFKADGTPVRYLLKLGKRDSPVCARIYDKGLETKTLSPGQWERLEVEFKEDRAAEVCLMLARSGEGLPQLLWEYVIGAFDFRIKNGRTELTRRPRTQWWGQYVKQSQPRETKPIKKESSFTTWCGWFRASVGPRLLQLSKEMGITPHEFFDDLVHQLQPATTVVPAVIEARVNQAAKSKQDALGREPI